MTYLKAAGITVGVIALISGMIAFFIWLSMPPMIAVLVSMMALCLVAAIFLGALLLIGSV